MRPPDGVILRDARVLRLEHLLWMHRRIARGVAHEIANLQQMLLLPDPPAEMRDELDHRMVALVELLGRTARETDEGSAVVPVPAVRAWHDAAKGHDRLGGENRARWTVRDAPADPVAWVRPEALQRVLVTILVLAARALDRGSVVESELSVEGGVELRFVAEVPSCGIAPDAEARWLEACAESWLAREHGTLLVERGPTRARFVATVPGARSTSRT